MLSCVLYVQSDLSLFLKENDQKLGVDDGDEGKILRHKNSGCNPTLYRIFYLCKELFYIIV